MRATSELFSTNSSRQSDSRLRRFAAGAAALALGLLGTSTFSGSSTAAIDPVFELTAAFSALNGPDRVSPGESFVTDGVADVRYFVKIEAPGSHTISYVRVQSGGNHWDTVPGGFWAVGVTAATVGAPFLNAADADIAAPITDKQDLFLYMANDTSQQPGATFTVEVCLDGTTSTPGTCRTEQVTVPPAEVVLTGTVRDFKAFHESGGHPDFERVGGSETGIVQSTLGSDDKPVYNDVSHGSVTSKESFDQWYRDVSGVNLSAPESITLTYNSAANRYEYSSSSFFPIDNELFGNYPGHSHNYHFTYELNLQFTYYAGSGQVFEFSGDDDIFVFINDKLAIDLGGIHGEQNASVNLDAAAATLGLTNGQTYPLNLFFAERHTTGSNFKMFTSLNLTTAAPSNTAPVAAAGSDVSGAEGSPISLVGSATDADVGDTLTYLWTYDATGNDAGAACSFGSAISASTSVTCTDDGTYTVTLTASDGTASHGDPATVTVSNVAPVPTITAPTDGSTFSIANPVNLTSTITDAGANDTRTCEIQWGDGATSNTCTGSHTYTAAGPYTVRLTATDDDGGTNYDEVLITGVAGGEKVTGGGFVISNGRTSFGFVATSIGGYAGKLQARTPVGRFHGDTVTALTATSTTATWSGTGRWNGDDGYGYTVSVVDNRSGGSKKLASPDTITLTVTHNGSTVYTVTGPLKGGNITVH